MDFAFRTDISVVIQLAGAISEAEIKATEQGKLKFKKKIRPLIIPPDGVLKADALKDLYFPSNAFDGTEYDVFPV